MTVSGVPPRDSGVVEVARFDVLPGSEEAFADAYLLVRHELVTTPGCRSVRMTRGVESPSRFVLFVDWDSLEAHTETFRGSDRFTRWRAALSPYFASAPAVEHVVAIADRADPAGPPATSA
ncbi:MULTISPECIES: antibiotic biosynthesis monooxygenase family protein [Parafrankia]|uniref:Antibiotic biosynthesis monooxygenase n=1 Tax=Parafrankia colletiae TaxID=573497 RepID=A0A1S1QXC4_9ACTN|nr:MULTISPECIES: antibiotic biosynthesis monooxygenase family protein [Parafrankia]MCK9898869.1 antibiotic biosynthesis monooxygenase [Frankia sp. Cpl3]OHV38327.1 antibiotic biosynthesis monooxygenase [Parafrankia colletiae]